MPVMNTEMNVYLVRHKSTGAVSHVCADKWTARYLADPDEEIEAWPFEEENNIPIFETTPSVKGAHAAWRAR